MKQNETNLIYARQYEIERDVKQTLMEINREEESLSLLNLNLNETTTLIDSLQDKVKNYTEILHDRKPADIREMIEKISEKKISLSSNDLETNINEIRSLVEQAQRSSQTGNEGEKIRDATVKLTRAKNIENDLFTYVR